MSIINEALKKTQDRIGKNTPSPVPPAAQSSTPPPSGTNQTSSKNILRVILFFILAMGVAFVFVRKDFIPQKSSQKNKIRQNYSAPQAKPTVVEPQVTTPAPVTPEPEAPSVPSLVLNGIMTMDNEQFALINNQIYRVGDTVEKKLLVNIGANTVELSEKGKKIILTTGTTNLTK